jgi:hypothetical protein
MGYQQGGYGGGYGPGYGQQGGYYDQDRGRGNGGAMDACFATLAACCCLEACCFLF